MERKSPIPSDARDTMQRPLNRTRSTKAAGIAAVCPPPIEWGCVIGRGILVVATALTLAAGQGASASGWRTLEPGLELSQLGSAGPEAGIIVLRIDPDFFEFELFNASADNEIPLTPRQWSRSKGLVAVINASMFQQDLLTSVSLMRTEHHVNNAYLSKDNTVLAFDPAVDSVPPVKIIDRQCENLDNWKASYHTLIQSIRMISCEGANVWRAQSRQSSTAALAVDEQGRVLFVHAEPELATDELIDILLQSPLNIARAMYLEGGPQAQLYIKSAGEPIELTGRLNPVFSQGGKLAWPLPNVIGITRKSGADRIQP